jgi:hypothetical protein
VGGLLKALEGIDAQALVQPFRQASADARYRHQQCYRVAVLPQPIEEGKMSGRKDGLDRSGQPRSDSRNGVEAQQSFGGQDLRQRSRPRSENLGGVLVGADPKGIGSLFAQNSGDGRELVGHFCVRWYPALRAMLACFTGGRGAALRVTRPAVPTGLERPTPNCWAGPGGTNRCLGGTVLTTDLMAPAAAQRGIYHRRHEAAVKAG